MSIDNLPAVRRRAACVAASAMLALGAFACNDTTSSDGTRDRIAPRVTLTPVSAADTVIAFTTVATDNIGLKTVRVQAIGAVGLAYDTTFTSAVTNFQLPFTLFSSRAVPAGTPVTITATAIDGAGNTSGVDTLIMATGNVPPPEVKVISPTSGSSAVLGKSILVTVSGKTGLKVLSLGLRTTGPVVYTDSVVYSSPLRDSITMQDTINIPADATPGTLTVIPFLRDSLGQRAEGASITITIQTAAQINSVPVVNAYCIGNQAYNNACGHGIRVEVGDTVHVEADDPSGISALGYEVRRTVGGAIDDTQTFTSDGQLTFLPHTFLMRLPYNTFPTTAYIQTFAVNSNGVRAYAKLSSGLDRIDTVTVVAGVTRALPFGGQVADALYHSGKDRLYLTNITRNQVEVFSLTDSSFKNPVIVGSRPWGLTAWPRDRNGGMGDTVLVANSGGTDISYIDLNVGADGAEVFRYSLPNLIVYSVTTVTSGTSGLPFQQRTRYDFSDRPQFPAATCIAGAGACDEVVLAYTTTPTPGQTSPFDELNGTIRWENLTRGVTVAGKTDFRTSHFVWEPASGQAAGRADTLEILRFDANGIDSTVLLPFKQTVGTPPNDVTYSFVARLNELGYRDTTFARNSGNFQRAIFGEGGSVFGSRAVAYDVDRGFRMTAPDRLGVEHPLPIPSVDMGVSPATAVSDFIGNTFAQVKGVAINFDGSLSAIRADSTYVLNPLLRLQGVLNTTVTNAGLDFHPLNTGSNSFPLNTRLAFAASSEPLIEIFDSHCYQRVSSIPISNPIIGPIKAAYRIGTGQLVLVGATSRGVVIVTLPNTFTTTCQ